MSGADAGGFPPLTIDFDSRWLKVDLRMSADDWGAQSAARLLAGAGGPLKGRATKQLTAYLTAAVGLATRIPDALAVFMLCPPPEHLVKCLVKLVAVELDADDVAAGVETARRLVALPELNYVEPPEVVELATGAGPAARGRGRITDPGDERTVTELLNYAWVLPGYPYAAVLGTAFTDLVEAGRWLPALDALAAAVELAPEQAPG